MVISSYSLFLRIFHFPFSFNSIYFYLGWFWAPSKASSGVYHAILGHIGNREVFRRSGKINGKYGNFERFLQRQYTLAEKCFSENVMYVPPMSDSSLWLLSAALDFWEIIILKSTPTLHLI